MSEKRWNFHKGHEGIEVCKGLHEKHESCEANAELLTVEDCEQLVGRIAQLEAQLAHIKDYWLQLKAQGLTHYDSPHRLDGYEIDVKEGEIMDDLLGIEPQQEAEEDDDSPDPEQICYYCGQDSCDCDML